jgi:carboxyl-terminal processing protease
VLEFVDINRNKLISQFGNVRNFRENFIIDQELLRRLMEYAEKKGVPVVEKDFSVSKEQIETLLKAYIARDLWSNSEFFYISNEKDPKFETAMTILMNWDKYEAMLLNTK